MDMDLQSLASRAQERFAQHMRQAALALFWAHHDRVKGDPENWEAEMWAAHHHIEQMRLWSARYHKISKKMA